MHRRAAKEVPFWTVLLCIVAAGLSDEGGAGANVGFAIKQRFAPVAREVAQLDRCVRGRWAQANEASLCTGGRWQRRRCAPRGGERIGVVGPPEGR